MPIIAVINSCAVIESKIKDGNNNLARCLKLNSSYNIQFLTTNLILSKMQCETVTLDLRASLPYMVKGRIQHVTINKVEFDI